MSQLLDHEILSARRPGRRAQFFRSLCLMAGGLALLHSTPTSAEEADQRYAAAMSALEVFQQREDRLFQAGYRLATANARFCEQPIKASGLLMHDAASYGDPEAVRRTFQLSGDIAVQSVASTSPAYTAGIRQNDTIIAIQGTPVGSESPSAEPRWKRVVDLQDSIDTALASRTVKITWKSPNGLRRTAAIEGIEACPTRFELIDSKSNAAADGDRVLIGEKFPGFDYDEAAFAAAVAHEMAHNILRHPQLFSEIGWKRKLVRLSERDADRLMPWLLFNAGYDPRAAIRFMSRWGPKHGGWIFRKRTHDGWDERVEFIEAELPKIERAAQQDSDGLADWSHFFVGALQGRLSQD